MSGDKTFKEGKIAVLKRRVLSVFRTKISSALLHEHRCIYDFLTHTALTYNE